MATFSECKNDCIDEGFLFCTYQSHIAGKCCISGDTTCPRSNYCSNDNVTRTHWKYFSCPNGRYCGPLSQFKAVSDRRSRFINSLAISDQNENLFKGTYCSFAIIHPVDGNQGSKTRAWVSKNDKCVVRVKFGVKFSPTADDVENDNLRNNVYVSAAWPKNIYISVEGTEENFACEFTITYQFIPGPFTGVDVPEEEEEQ